MKNTFPIIRYSQLFAALCMLMVVAGCKNNDDEDGTGSQVHPDLSVQLAVTGDAEQTLNFTNPENKTGTHNATALYEADKGELTILGNGQGNYMWIVKVSANSISTGSKVVLDGTYVNQLDGANKSFNDLESGTFNLSDVALLYETVGGNFYSISGSFTVQLSDTPGTVSVTGSFENMVLTAPN